MMTLKESQWGSNMGNLKPGATYIYEKADGITYAQEVGANNRTPIGWDYQVDEKLIDLKEDHLWKEIRRSAKTNPVLQKELDRVTMLYHLSKEDGQE